MLFLVLLVLASSVDASGVLLHDSVYFQDNTHLGDLWSSNVKVIANSSHTYTLRSASSAQVFVDDHIGVSVDNGPWFDVH
jgi:hypothetical protein